MISFYNDSRGQRGHLRAAGQGEHYCIIIIIILLLLLYFIMILAASAAIYGLRGKENIIAVSYY